MAIGDEGNNLVTIKKKKLRKRASYSLSITQNTMDGQVI